MTLTDLVTRLQTVATSKMLAVDHDVLLSIKIDGIVDAYSWIAVQFAEPSSVEHPLDVFWLRADPDDPLYGYLYRRVSRTGGSPTVGVWEAVTLAQVTEKAHTWDFTKPDNFVTLSHSMDISDPHRQEPVGGQLSSALKPRTLAQDENYASDEVVPFSIISSTIGAAVSLTNRVQQGLNFLNFKFKQLTARVVILEESNIRGMSQEQSTLAQEWVIPHNLNSENLMVEVFNEAKHVVYPSEVSIVDLNTLSIKFAVEMKGRANIRPI